jgi:hypothetical protein
VRVVFKKFGLFLPEFMSENETIIQWQIVTLKMLPHYRPLELREVEAPRISRHSAVEGGKVVRGCQTQGHGAAGRFHWVT